MPITWQEGNVIRPAPPTPEAAEITPDGSGEARPARPANPMAALGRARAGKRDTAGAKIEQMADETNRRPIALFVYAGSSEAKFAASKAACAKFEKEIFGDYDVSVQLQNFVTLRIDGTTLDKELRSKYGIRKGRYPQLILYDCTGKRIAAYSAGTPAGIAAALKSALQRSNLVARRLAAKGK